MRIAIDVHPLQTAARSDGVGEYLRNVLQQFPALDGENEYTFLLSNSDSLTNINTVDLNLKKHYLTRKQCLGRWWWCWDTVYLPTAFVRKNIDLYHYNSVTEVEKLFPPPPFGKHRVVATVYNLVPFKFPQPSSSSPVVLRWNSDSFWKLQRLQRADAIITPSQASKQELCEMLNYPQKQIFVAPCGISEHFKQPPDQEHAECVKAKYQLPEQFILYVGGYTCARKNIERLLNAYNIVCRNLPAPSPKLVLTGLSQSPHQKEILFCVHALKLTSHVHPLPEIPAEERSCLYRTASLVVYPSLYEDFARPVVEALTCGAVVAVSDTSSFPEIVGDAGLYFDPSDPHAIAATMYKGLTHPDIRRTVQRKAPHQAAQFSWKEAARTILSVYNQVHNS